MANVYCGELLLKELGDCYEATSIFKPIAKFQQVTENINQLTSDFTDKDYTVIIADTNDIKHLGQ